MQSGSSAMGVKFIIEYTSPTPFYVVYVHCKQILQKGIKYSCSRASTCAELFLGIEVIIKSVFLLPVQLWAVAIKAATRTQMSNFAMIRFRQRKQTFRKLDQLSSSQLSAVCFCCLRWLAWSGPDRKPVYTKDYAFHHPSSPKAFERQPGH